MVSTATAKRTVANIMVMEEVMAKETTIARKWRRRHRHLKWWQRW